jgi:hypothetical protein
MNDEIERVEACLKKRIELMNRCRERHDDANFRYWSARAGEATEKLNCLKAIAEFEAQGQSTWYEEHFDHFLCRTGEDKAMDAVSVGYLQLGLTGINYGAVKVTHDEVQYEVTKEDIVAHEDALLADLLAKRGLVAVTPEHAKGLDVLIESVQDLKEVGKRTAEISEKYGLDDPVVRNLGVVSEYGGVRMGMHAWQAED